MAKNILIVDDQAFIRHILSIELTKAGYTVLQAENGKVGFELALKTLPDLILMDLMMPIMDGFEACKKIKESALTNKVPVIFLSANNQKDAIIKAIQCGGSDFVVKSPNSAVLIQKIKKLFNE